MKCEVGIGWNSRCGVGGLAAASCNPGTPLPQGSRAVAFVVHSLVDLLLLRDGSPRHGGWVLAGAAGLGSHSLRSLRCRPGPRTLRTLSLRVTVRCWCAASGCLSHAEHAVRRLGGAERPYRADQGLESNWGAERAERGAQATAARAGAAPYRPPPRHPCEPASLLDPLPLPPGPVGDCPAPPRSPPHRTAPSPTPPQEDDATRCYPTPRGVATPGGATSAASLG